MIEDRYAVLEDRVGVLERQMSELLGRQAAGAAHPAQRPAPQKRRTLPNRADPAGGEVGRPGTAGSGAGSIVHRDRAGGVEQDAEKWLGRVGIGFVVLAFAFLLKLSFDRGWITPPVRLGVGFTTGLALVAGGLRLDTSRRQLAEVLLGGGVVLLYLVGFASSQLYGLLPLRVAFSIMATTGVLALVLSEHRDSPALSIMGVAGGLATPYLLDVAVGHSGPVAIYASVVLLGATPVYLHRGWPLLLSGLVVGGGAILVDIVAVPGASTPALPVAGLLVLYWIISTWSPLVRPLSRSAGPGLDDVVVARLSAAVGTYVTAVAAAGYFDFGRAGGGWLVLAMGLSLAAFAYAARREPRSTVPAGDLAACAIAVGLWLVIWSQAGMLALLVEVAVLLILTDRGGSPTLAKIAHGLAAAVAMLFLIYSGPEAPVGLFSGYDSAMLRLAVVVLTAVIALWAGEYGTIYRGAAYVGLLVFFLAELVSLPNGQVLVSAAWAAQGTAALLASLRSRSRTLQVGGLGTLALVSTKLLLVDMNEADPVVRIAMLMVFGSVLVGLGYLINREPDADGRGGRHEA